MKLCSKKTGEVIELKLVRANCEYLIDHKIDTIYGEEVSLKTLNKYYKDYNPQEPLIKDEKIRKAVRDWAYVNSVKQVIYTQNHSKNLFIITDSDECYFIQFVGWIPELQDSCSYTIAELCGEEEDA